MKTPGQSVFTNLRIVLVETSHPGNIGAAARAMKCMGLRELCLVRPARFPCAEATARASGADDLLMNARITDSLREAVGDSALVVGTSARQRRIPWPLMQPEECAALLCETAATAPVSLVFGREQSGLNNEELELCHRLVTIPTVTEFSSLNLAAAVQVLTYEISRQAGLSNKLVAGRKESTTPLATAEQLELLYSHLEKTMLAVDFLDPANPRRLMRRLRRLFNRAALDHNEMQILRGFLAAIDKIVAGEGRD